MSGTSTNLGETTTWTGTGWTGQPCIFERDGKTWVVFGAYDYKIHFLDAETGEKLLPDFKGGDIFKGSAVVDPDGYPLIYMGCRDNKWRIIAIDRDEPTELFNLDADELPEPDLERRLGFERGHPQRLRLRGRREQPLLHPQAQPRLRRRRQGDRRSRDRARLPRLDPDPARQARQQGRVGGELALPGGRPGLLLELRRSRHRVST